MKSKESKVANLISNKVAQQLEGIKDGVSKSKSTKSKATKTKESNLKLVELPNKKNSKKEEVVKEVEKQQKPSIIEKVVSNREVKYVYPADIIDTLARKKWRQQTRNELHRLEREMYRIKDTNSQEFKKAAKAFEEFRNKVLKPEQVA